MDNLPGRLLADSNISPGKPALDNEFPGLTPEVRDALALGPVPPDWKRTKLIFHHDYLHDGDQELRVSFTLHWNIDSCTHKNHI